MIQVHGHGPSGAKLAIVGEAPGQIEEQLGYPFAGPTGKMVNDFLLKAGTQRSAVYATNVVRVRPPGNNIELLYQTGYKIEDFLEIMWAELNVLRPNAVIAFGNTALTALTGYKGIEKYRGSILPALRGNFKVIPTIHPASLMHKESDGRMSGWKDATFIQWDVNRAVYQASFPDLLIPNRNLIVCRSNLELYRFFNRYQGAPFVSVDIETFRTIPICVSFAFNSTEAISVPLFPSLSKDLDVTRTDQIQNWKDVAEIMHDVKIQKIGQNFKFDETLLKTCLNNTVDFGIHTNGFYFDTMLAFRTLYPELPGTLAFQTSVLTEEPYYKEEGKGYNPKKDKIDRLLLYNAKDAVITYECYEKELSELRERNLDGFFFERVMPLHPFYSRLEQRGIRRDNFAKRFLEEKYKGIWQEQQKELDELATSFGMELDPFIWNEKKHTFIGGCNVQSVSPNGMMPTLVYIAMQCPPRKGTDEKTLDAMMRNAVKDPIKVKTLKLILSIRKIRKTLNTYINAESYPDGRLRTSYRIMLETGRTSTSICEPPITTKKMGMAFQTITKHSEYGSDLRSQFIPDEGYILIEPDLSQAEARVVALLARDEKLLKMFKYKVDIHNVTSAWLREKKIPMLDDFFNPNYDILGLQLLADELNKQMQSFTTEDERQTGKKSRHAGHYDMGKREAASQLKTSEALAQKFLTKFHASNPNIKQVFHKEIIDFLNKNNRILTNPFGRVRQFLNKWGDELFKEAYAQIPQSTVSDQVKFAMLRIEPRAPQLQILEESHDSFLGQLPLCIGSMYPFKILDNYAKVIQEELEVPINFSCCSLPRKQLIIPCDIKIGKENWENMEKYKLN